MKLALLPGLDGSGVLFQPLLECLSGLDVEVITLPDSGPQDYDFLSEYVASRLPDRDFVLLAESFSGALLERLLANKGCHPRGVVFVASFLSSPAPWLVWVVARLPLKLLIRLPIVAPFVCRALIFGKFASADLTRLLFKALERTQSSVLRARLRQIASCQASSTVFPVDALYIRPANDRLVSNRRCEFERKFPRLKTIDVAGPHFILQSRPDICAEYIRQWVSQLSESSGSSQ